MVAENFAELNNTFSLEVNGHHRVPPRPATWPLSSPLGAGAAGLPAIMSLEPASLEPTLWRLCASTRWGPSRGRERPDEPDNVSGGLIRVFSSSTFTDKSDLSNSPKSNFQTTG